MGRASGGACQSVFGSSYFIANYLATRPGAVVNLNRSFSSLVMGPKPRNIDPENGVTGEALRRSARSSCGIGGTLRQLEYIETHQTVPHVPQNEEARRIQGMLGRQPKNLLAPSNRSRKTAKESKVRRTIYILDHKLTNNMKTPSVVPAPPSPILLRKQVASTKDSYGFYNDRDFSQPPFTQ